ncbi:MAG: ROK family protein [Acidobacteria bacterium]|nr:ROK family protein [Acidobacteriota bacterium]
MDLAAGVDFGGSSVKVGLVDRKGGVHARETIQIDPRASFEAILDPVVRGLRRLVGTIGKGSSLAAVGIGTPGFTDTVTGVLVGGCENIPRLRGNSIQAFLADAMGVPGFADNDATVAAAGELLFGAGRKYRNFVLITLGTGIGGGFVLDGRVYRGARGFAAEIGHLCADPNGVWCNCGSRGCLEQYASGPAMVRLYTEKAKKRGAELPARALTPKDVVDRASGGDALARDTIEEAGRFLAQAFGTILNLLNLEACIVGGGISQAGEIVLEPIRRHLGDHCWPLIASGVQVVTAELLNDAGILGAAAQAFERLER